MFYCDFLLVKEKTAFLMSHSRMDQDRKIGNSNWNFPFEKLLVRKTKKFRPVFVNFETTKFFFFSASESRQIRFRNGATLAQKKWKQGSGWNKCEICQPFLKRRSFTFLLFYFLESTIMLLFSQWFGKKPWFQLPIYKFKRQQTKKKTTRCK